MRFHKKVKPFYFINDGQSLKKDMEPIQISHHSDLIERIHARYPYINQVKIAHIVLSTFEVIRDLLLQGCILTIKRLMMDCKLHFFQHTENNIDYPAVKVRTGTPVDWKVKDKFDE